jgi:RimJ/RimL family protein N-acetyltransferase
MNNSLAVTTAVLDRIAPDGGYAPCWRDSLPKLVGERATLRELRPADAATLLPLISAPEVCRFISAPPVSLDRFESFIAWSHAEREAGRYVAFAVIPAGRHTAAGLVQVRQLDPGFQTAEWGIALGADFWGQGLFGDASRLLLDFAFGMIGARRLEARAAVPNVRAQVAMQKLGAVREGVLRQSLVTADGRQFDQVLWSVLADDWRRQTEPTGSVLVH